MGRLFEKEYEVLSDILEAPKRPCVFVLGGAKIQDAFLMMDKVLVEGIADKVLCRRASCQHNADSQQDWI